MSVTIRDFERIANGTHNLGSVRLNRSGNGLDKINHHRFKLINWTADNAEQNRRVREALVTAFENDGMSKTSLDALRKKLGLQPGQNEGGTPLLRRDLKVILSEQKQFKDYFETNVNGMWTAAFSDVSDEYNKKIDFNHRPKDPDAVEKLLNKSIEFAKEEIGVKLSSGELKKFRPKDVVNSAMEYINVALNQSLGKSAAKLNSALTAQPVNAEEVKRQINRFMGILRDTGWSSNQSKRNDDFHRLGLDFAAHLSDKGKKALRELFRGSKDFAMQAGFGGLQTGVANPRLAFFTGLIDGAGIPCTKMNKVFDRFVKDFSDQVEKRTAEFQEQHQDVFLAKLQKRFGTERAEIERNVKETMLSNETFWGVLEFDFIDPARTMQTLEEHIKVAVKTLTYEKNSITNNNRLSAAGAPQLFYRELVIDKLLKNGLVVNGEKFTEETKRRVSDKEYGGKEARESSYCQNEPMKALHEKIWTEVPEQLIPAVTFLCTSGGLMSGANGFLVPDGTIFCNDAPKENFTAAAVNSVQVGMSGATIDGLEIDTTQPDGVHVKVMTKYGLKPVGNFNHLFGNSISKNVTDELMSEGIVTFEAVVPRDWSLDARDTSTIKIVGMTGTLATGETIDIHV